MANEIPLENVRHMAMLSRLSISDMEEKIFARQFGDILNHIHILETINTQDIEPLYNVSEQISITREDFADNMRDRAEILSNAPETDGQCFLVPRIV